MQEHLFFIHIPKTAGSSIRWSFEQALGAEHTRFISTGNKVEQLEKLDLPSLGVVGGHIPLWEFQKCRPCRELQWKMVALLREPRTRFLSLYNFLLQSDHPEHRIFDDMSLGDFAGLCRKGGRPDFDMCWYFHPSGCCDAALEVIRRHKVEIYTMEEIPQFYKAMEFFFDVPLPTATLNKSRPSVTVEDLAGLDLSFLEEDMKLYEAVRSGCLQDALPLRITRRMKVGLIRASRPVRRFAALFPLLVRQRLSRRLLRTHR